MLVRVMARGAGKRATLHARGSARRSDERAFSTPPPHAASTSPLPRSPTPLPVLTDSSCLSDLSRCGKRRFGPRASRGGPAARGGAAKGGSALQRQVAVRPSSRSQGFALYHALLQAFAFCLASPPCRPQASVSPMPRFGPRISGQQSDQAAFQAWLECIKKAGSVAVPWCRCFKWPDMI